MEVLDDRPVAPDEATESTDTEALVPSSLSVPPLLWSPLAAAWPVATEPGAENLPRPGAAAPAQPKGKDKGAGADARDDPEANIRKTRAAAELARRAYQELNATAQRHQDAFVARANQTASAMSGAQESIGAQIRHDLDADLADFDAAAARAERAVKSSAELALTQLDAASRDAREAISKAAKDANNLITSGVNNAAAQIATVVGGLVYGHHAAYDGAISRTRRAADAAMLALNSWRDDRLHHFSTETGSPLNGAKNEAKQMRVPPLADREATELNRRSTQKLEAWGSTRDSTVRGLKCNYSCALESENKAAAQQGRDAVTNTLGQARTSLEQQTREGHHVLQDLRSSTLRQIATRKQAAKQHLRQEAQASLGGARGEAQGAVKSALAAANAALPGFRRGVEGFRLTLRGASAKGPEVASQTARTAPAGVIQGLQRSKDMLSRNLDGNLDQLQGNLAAGSERLRTSAEAFKALQVQSLHSQADAADAAFDQASDGFVTAFAGLDETVTQAAASWAQPLATRMASSIQSKREEAARALQGILTGQPPSGGGNTAGTANTTGAANAGEAACSQCASTEQAATTSPAASPAGNATASGASAEPQGLTAQETEEVTYYNVRLDPDTLFNIPLTRAGQRVEQDLRAKTAAVTNKFSGGFAGTVDEAGVIAALRGLTKPKGVALDLEVYPDASGTGLTLDTQLRRQLGEDSHDYSAASAYLKGNVEEGARLELADSTHWYNDDEARIEATLRALSPAQLGNLGAAHPSEMQQVREALGGTDLQVFDALAAGNHAKADAYRLRDAVDTARRDGNADAVHGAIEQWTEAPSAGDWRASDEAAALTGDDPNMTETNRLAVVRQLGGIVGEVAGAVTTDAQGNPLSADRLAEERAVAYVTRDIEVQVGGGEGGPPQTVTLRIQGANRDLAASLLRHGQDSVQTRVARVGVELQRTGDRPDPAKLDRAMYDQRFAPDRPDATAEELDANRRAREQAHADRERVLLLAAQTYAGDSERLNTSHDPDAVLQQGYQADAGQVDNARQALIDRLGARYGSDTLGAKLAAGLLTDERPSPNTVALAMQHAQQGSGTNEDLLIRFTERMTRSENAEMRVRYQANTGRSLDADLGTYGEGGTFTELSGDDRLRMERALRGVAQTDQERLENAAFALAQQRRETGALGAWLADGTLADRMMSASERELAQQAGGEISFGQHGQLLTHLPNFNPQTGDYTGTNRDSFLASTSVAQAVADNYSARIDAYADVATTGLAVVGAIAAAAITVATGGAAAPLIAAALVTGLASMSANYAIKGGRYGWEQAAVDLGMTAVQAVTAGVGAQLGAAAQVASKSAQAASQVSRSLTTLSRLFTGNPLVDQMIVGAITGGIGGLGNTALDEHTWDRGGDPVGALFAGLLKGALSGAATSALTNSIEGLGTRGQAIRDRAQALVSNPGSGRALTTLERGLGRMAFIQDALGAAAGSGWRGMGGMAARGVVRGSISGLGGMAGRGTEIAVDAARGKYRGDAGDALLDMGQAGLHSFVQGIGEGVAESHGQRIQQRHEAEAGQRVNQERQAQGLEPLAGPDLKAAAADLMFLDQHGRQSPADRLRHISTHGGMEATVVTRQPAPVVEDTMRAALLRHVPADVQGDFANVPIRVLSPEEFHTMTRSASGTAVTLIENGHPVVVVKEGTPIAHLADEGPHLQQARESHTRERAARLDETTLAQWDSLDLGTQLSLYQTKIELEIDAHQRIATSLEAEATRAGPEGADHLAADIERNATTLRNLQARLQEVENLSPQHIADMAVGQRSRPDYLEQPARLFSKEAQAPERRGFTAEEIAAHLEQTQEEQRASMGKPRPGELAEGEPHTPPLVAPEGDGRALFDRMPEQWEEPAARIERGNTFNTEQESRFTHNELYVESPDGKARFRVDSYEPGEAIVSRKYTQLAELSVEHAVAYINELVEKYPRGARISDVPSTPEHLRGQALDGHHVLLVPEQLTPVPHEVLEFARRAGVSIVDPDGRRYTVEYPGGNDRRSRRASSEPGVHSEAMRESLLRHVPEHLRSSFSDTVIEVLPEQIYRTLTGSQRGPVATLIRDGDPFVVIREGTPISRLADEGPHLVQSHDSRTRDRVALHDEAVMQRWNSLDLDTQITLYRNKLELEIDAHQRILDSLQSEAPDTPAGRRRQAFEQGRNEATLDNLHQRLAEVDGLTATDRAVMSTDPARRPQYLNEPARLFSKDMAPPPRVTTVFEPFAGPSLASAHDLQARHPGAQVITSEALYPPSAAEIADFQKSGGRFVQDRFGETLPDNAVDRMHVRFPLPHSKGNEATLQDLMQRYPGKEPMEAADAHLANIESIHNLGPHALRTLKPGGEMEVVYWEAKEIGGELARLQQRIWTDPATGERYRLQAVGPAVMQPRSVAPHSGFGIPDSATSISVMNLRKVRVQDPAEIEARGHLLRHVPEDMRSQFADVRIRTLPEAEYRALTQSDSGPVVTLIRDGRPEVVMREGTPPSRLADEGPHLLQAHETATAAQVARLDEANLANWHSLDLDTQLDLYRTKIALEIDAHQRIQASMEAELARGNHPPELADEIRRNATTLQNLRARQTEVTGIGLLKRLAMRHGLAARPDYLGQPPRLFSKDAPLAQRFAHELGDFPQLHADLLAASRIIEPQQRATALAQVHARLIGLRHLENLASKHTASGSDFSFNQLRGVAARHNLPEAVVMRHVEELLNSGRHPDGVVPAGEYGRHLLHLAESLVGPRPASPPRLIVPLPQPLGETTAPKPPQPTAKPEAAPEPSPADLKRLERMAKAAAELPDLLRARGVDPALLDGATRGDILNIYNALDGDPIASAAGKKPTQPTELQKAVAQWALANCDGKAGEFHALYEYARARFSDLREQQELALKGTNGGRIQAATNAGAMLTEKFLTDMLKQDMKELATFPAHQNLAGPTTGMTHTTVAQAVQGLDQIRFGSPALEIYHAWKHRKEIPAGFNGTLLERYRAATMQTVRNGTIKFSGPALPPDPATRIIIHMAFGQPPTQEIKEAILRVEPDGNVTISSWGDPKAIKP